MPDDRQQRPFSPRGRPPLGGGGPRPGGFVPRPGYPPRPAAAAPPETTSIRLRDGDRELEVHGSPPFCRQIVDDLPQLLARLRGEPTATNTAIALPSPPTPAALSSVGAPPRQDPAAPPAAGDGDRGGVEAVAPPASGGAAAPAGNGHRGPRHPSPSLDDEVIGVLRSSSRPLGIAEIRAKLREPVSGQAVRRILERATDRVVSVGGRPAAYRVR